MKNFVVAMMLMVPSILSFTKVRHVSQVFNRAALSVSKNSQIDESLQNKIMSNDDLQKYLNGTAQKEWKGTKSMLQRRGELPDPKYKPIDVIRVCLKALESNDYPQLDHGACVVLEFRAPDSPLQVFTNPAEFGTYLRGNDYKCILDFKVARPIGEAVILKQEAGETVSIKQKVEITNFPDYNTVKAVFPDSTDGSSAPQRVQDVKVNFNFFLSLHGDVWLIDALQRDD